MSQTSSLTIHPRASWPDDRGLHIQAHGGGIIRLDGTWYWFGEDRGRDNAPDRRQVACYSSRDLVNWTFRNQVINLADPESFGHEWVLERPKVFHNEKTGKFVMYMHIDGRITPDHKSRYSVARVGVAVSDTVDGDYQYVTSFRPLGCESRDIGQFIDDDGTAYLIFEDRLNKGFHISKLSEDYMTVEKDMSFLSAPIEGGAIVKHEGLYYVLGSALTGWEPNPNQYAVATSLEGPWSEFRDIAPPATNTHGSQSTMLLKVQGTRKTTVIYMGDVWNPERQWESAYLWMPVEIGGGTMRLPEPRDWTLDVVTGETVFLD